MPWLKSHRDRAKPAHPFLCSCAKYSLVRLEDVAKNLKNKRKQQLEYISGSQKSPSEVGGKFPCDFTNKGVYTSLDYLKRRIYGCSLYLFDKSQNNFLHTHVVLVAFTHPKIYFQDGICFNFSTVL